jgi:hypothetical protein
VDENGSYEKKEFEIKAHILGNLPEEYSEVITKTTGENGNMDLSKIKKEIKGFWKCKFKEENDEKRDKEKDNLALAMQHKFKKFFKGKCRKCGKQGHKAADCYSKNQNANGNRGNSGNYHANQGGNCNTHGGNQNRGRQDNRKYYNCQTFDHIAAKCPEGRNIHEEGLFV